MPRATLHKLCDIPHFKGADLETLQRLLQAHGIESSFHVHVPDARAYTANDAFRTAMLALPAGQWPPSALRSVRTLLTGTSMATLRRSLTPGSFYRVFVRNVDLSRARTVVADFTFREGQQILKERQS